MRFNVLPPACKQPCAECPWRKEALPGYLGPHDAQTWLDTARSETPVACHMTLSDKGWQGKKVRQCAGIAAFRLNLCKKLRNPSDATHDLQMQQHRQNVFRKADEFLKHHHRD